jgi:hypothetical protein
MFDLSPSYTNPIRRTKTSQRFQLGTDRGLPPSLEADEKAYLVELSSEDDPANAKNWAFSRKMIAALILGFDTLVASWGSSVYSAAVMPVSLEFGVGSVVSLLGLTLYICGFATGPLAFAPLSELYGRRYPITIAAFVFVSGTMFPLERLAPTAFHRRFHAQDRNPSVLLNLKVSAHYLCRHASCSLVPRRKTSRRLCCAASLPVYSHLAHSLS